jgi:hypothetical protein
MTGEIYSLDPRDQPFASDEELDAERDEPEAEQDVPTLDAFDIAAINAARSVLNKFKELRPEVVPTEGWERDYHMRSFGHAQGIAEQAESMLFDLLNYSKHHLGMEVTSEQMFNNSDDDEV